MKRIIAVLGIAIFTFSLSGCSKLVVADVTITYEVTATTTLRDLDISYANITNGEDIANDLATLHFTKSFTIPSDSPKDIYYLDVYCYRGSGTPTQQTITTRIYEDDELIVERVVGGSGSIYSSDTYISAELPTAIKYE